MKYVIIDHTLWDPELCAGTFDTAEQAIDRLAPTFDLHWPEVWFIRKTADVYRLGVYNTTKTDSFVAVATIQPI